MVTIMGPCVSSTEHRIWNTEAEYSGAQRQKGLTLIREVKNCCTEEMTFQLALKDEQGLAMKRMQGKVQKNKLAFSENAL